MEKLNKPKRKRVSSPFAGNLKKVLDERGISIRSAAQICGVNQASVHSWLNGTQPHDVNCLLKLCKAVKCDFQWLLTGTHGQAKVQEMALQEIFETENDPAFSGIFQIEAKRLKRRKE